jgi:hypothetical protein
MKSFLLFEAPAEPKLASGHPAHTQGHLDGHRPCLKVFMRSFFPARTPRTIRLRKYAAFALMALLAGGCSRSEVHLTAAPAQPLTTGIQAAGPTQQTAAQRLVEIDRLLAAPVTGRSEDSDRRAVLRAERAALADSGQVPYRAQNQIASNRNRPAQNYAPAPAQVARVTVAPNSQDKNLSALEQMTPTERARYYKDVSLQNTSRVRIDVRHH